MTYNRHDLVYFTTQVRDTSDKSLTRVIRVRHKQHECNTSETQETRVQHECYTNDASATRVRNFDFDNDTSENIFSCRYISHMAYERLQGEEQFHSKGYLLEMFRSHIFKTTNVTTLTKAIIKSPYRVLQESPCLISCIIFEEKCFSGYNLLSDQISLHGCL